MDRQRKYRALREIRSNELFVLLKRHKDKDKEKSRNKEDVAASAEGEDSNDIYQQEQLQKAEVLHELLPGGPEAGRPHCSAGLLRRSSPSP